MSAKLLLGREQFGELRDHLFPEDFEGERAAFLFATTASEGQGLVFTIAEQLLVDEAGVCYSSAATWSLRTKHADA